jgi:hypothetical protein
MKKVKIALLMLLVTVLVMPACKKGTDDPFLSLKSRKGRLVGEWSLKDGSITQTSGGTSSTTTFNGTTCTGTFGGQSFSVTYTEKITIVKDGTYKIERSQGNGTSVDMSTIEGAWYFGAKNKDLGIKDKESVVFVETSNISTSNGTTTTNAYTGSNCPTSTFLLDELKGSEMICTVDGSSTGSSTSITTGTMTYEKK